jgi:hypothetical protein
MKLKLPKHRYRVRPNGHEEWHAYEKQSLSVPTFVRRSRANGARVVIRMKTAGKARIVREGSPVTRVPRELIVNEDGPPVSRQPLLQNGSSVQTSQKAPVSWGDEASFNPAWVRRQIMLAFVLLGFSFTADGVINPATGEIMPLATPTDQLISFLIGDDTAPTEDSADQVFAPDFAVTAFTEVEAV